MCCCGGSKAILIAATAKETQQQNKQVDEIKVQSQGPHDRTPLDRGFALFHKALLADLLDFLHVIGGKTNKDKHADHRDRPVQA